MYGGFNQTMISKLSLTLLAATLAFAQTTHTPPDPATMAQMRVNRLATELSLTDAQKTTALSIFTTAYTAAQTVQTNLQTNRQSLATAVKNNDAATIDQLAAASGTLSGQLTAINSKADAAFYAILTAAPEDDVRCRAARRPGWTRRFRRPRRDDAGRG